jgi:CPA2 family monovalent cation:H+ antiporter-2
MSPLLVGRSQATASWIAASLPKRIGTFASFYEAWLARLRLREESLWQRVRRPAILLAVDAAVVVAIAIAASTVARDGARAIGLVGTAADVAIVILALAIAAPFVIGMIRRVVRIARALAVEIVPDRSGDAPDLGRAPRRALMQTIELALSLAIVLPLIAITQPFLSNSALLVLVVLFALVVITYRSIVDFDQHVRAGSEVLLELMSHPTDEPSDPFAGVGGVLPGFDGTVSIRIPAAAAVVGRSLAELDLRASTGATVLAIARAGAGVATPSPTEPLRPGDVLAVAGSEDAIAAARALLGDGSVDGDRALSTTARGPA